MTTSLLLLALGALLVFLIITWNALTRLRLLSRNAWADIDVQLKRRHDLIPNLVAAVKGAAGFEKGTLESVVQARTRALAATGPAAAGAAERVLGDEVGRVFALAEAYPELRATASFLDLQRSLVEIEDHVQQSRRYYNAVVRDLNTRIQQFPTNLVAGAMGFASAEFFGLDDRAEAEAPRVQM